MYLSPILGEALFARWGWPCTLQSEARSGANSSPRGRGAVPADLDVLWCLARAIEAARPSQQCVDD
eukprot:scaffold22646_cov68-Phaeocystis_antarctica.AAC.1